MIADWVRRRELSSNKSDRFERQDYEYQLAKLAYEPPSNRLQRMNELGLEGELVEGLNNDEFFAVKQGGNVFNVHRGSQTTEDWLQSDVHLAVDQLEETDRFKRSLANSTEAERVTGLKSIEVGHSLGGTLAERIALKKGNASVVFNQGTSPLANYRGIDRNKNKHYRVEGDAVSGFDPTATVVGATNSVQSMLQTVLISNVVPGRVQPFFPWVVQTATSHPTSSFGGK